MVTFLLLFLIYLSIIFKHLNGEWLGVRAPYVELALFLTAIFMLICPFDILHRSTRMFFLQTVGRIVCAPFVAVNFKDFFLADHFCSLTRVFVDLAYSFCFYTTGDFVSDDAARCLRAQPKFIWICTILPYLWRLLQCLRRYSDSKQAKPHLLNAMKYSLSILISSFNIAQSLPGGHKLFPGWIFLATIGTLYSALWDVVMDWGLCNFSRGPNGVRKFVFLRHNSTLEEEHHWLYYWAAISNLFLRVSWVLSISPATFGITLAKENFLFMLGLLEILRRAQWSFFRLENEHLNNCEQFRAARFVPIEIGDEDHGHSPNPTPDPTKSKTKSRRKSNVVISTADSPAEGIELKVMIPKPGPVDPTLTLASAPGDLASPSQPELQSPTQPELQSPTQLEPVAEGAAQEMDVEPQTPTFDRYGSGLPEQVPYHSRTESYELGRLGIE